MNDITTRPITLVFADVYDDITNTSFLSVKALGKCSIRVFPDMITRNAYFDAHRKAFGIKSVGMFIITII